MGYVSKVTTADFTPIGIDFSVKVVVGLLAISVLICLFIVTRWVYRGLK